MNRIHWTISRNSVTESKLTKQGYVPCGLATRGVSMGEVIDFPVPVEKRIRDTRSTHEHDPYYHFIRNVLVTANACGFELPYTIESATERVYLKTRETSELARLLRGKPR